MKLLKLTLFLMSIQFCLAQNIQPLLKEADSLFRASEFKSAAMIFSSLSPLVSDQPGQFFRVNFFAARALTRANFPDSAFSALNRIADNKQMVHNHLMSITTEPDFESLRKDKRWIALTTRMFDSVTKDCYVPVNSAYTQEELIYGRKDGMALTMLRLRPEKSKPNGRTIIQIRSGGWGSGFYMPGVSDALPFIDKGYNVFIVFHGSEPVYTVPDAIEDLQRAVRFIRYNAKGYGLNPDRIAAIGNSAGGHLALMCALSDSSNTTYSPDPVDRMSSKVRAAVSYSPVSNFLEWDDKRNTGDSAFLFKKALTHVLEFRHWDARRRKFDYVTETNERKKILKQISPFYHVSKNDAAILLFHGDKDELVPVEQSRLLAQNLTAANVSALFQIKNGAGHGWPKNEDESTLVMKWLDEQLR